MLIPSIDLQRGRIVQLVQGEALALETHDVDAWTRRFAACPKVQVIDLDAAKDTGSNETLVQRLCRDLSCRVGGGIRSIEQARRVLSLGATKIILGSALFRDGRPDVEFAAELSDAIGADRLIGAVDSRGGSVVVHGWRTELPISPVDAIRTLEPYFGEFLYTHVDTEGLMRGTDVDAIRRVKSATHRHVTAAGGITTKAEVDLLHSMGIDAVVGMAIYTGRLQLSDD